MFEEIADRYVGASPQQEFELSLAVMHEEFDLDAKQRAALILGRQSAGRMIQNWDRLSERIADSNNAPVLIGHRPHNRYQAFSATSFPGLEILVGSEEQPSELFFDTSGRMPYDVGGGGGLPREQQQASPSATVAMKSRHQLEFNSGHTIGGDVKRDAIRWSTREAVETTLTAARITRDFISNDEDEDDKDSFANSVRMKEPAWEDVVKVYPRTEESVSEVVPVLVGDQIAQHMTSPSLWTEGGHGPELQNAMRHMMASSVYVSLSKEDDLQQEHTIHTEGVWFGRRNAINMLLDAPNRAVGGSSYDAIRSKPVEGKDLGKPAMSAAAYEKAHGFLMDAQTNEFGPETAKAEVEQALSLMFPRV